MSVCLSFFYLQIDNLKEAVNKSGNSELVQNFNRLEKFLSENGHIVEKVKFFKILRWSALNCNFYHF